MLAKVVMYLALSFLFVFYPGRNDFLRYYSLDAYAFQELARFSYRLEPRPRLSPIPDPLSLPQITAESYLVMDLDSFTPIIAKAPRRKMFPASTVKLATALLAYDHYDLEKVLKVNKVITQEVRMGLKKNERISVLNLLYGTLIYSANDAAYTLAENYPGGVGAFVEEMNRLARRLNMRDTSFQNPIGFDHREQYTTAQDLALLAREFIKNHILLTITSTKSITVSDVDYENFHYLQSSNELLGEVPHLGGLKTGTTEQAGQNLISFYKFRNKPLAIIVLKSSDRFGDTRQLINLIETGLGYEEVSL